MRERDAQSAARRTRKHAEVLSSTLSRTATALEKSAALAEQHARREERAGRRDGAAEERRAAGVALESARRARSQANEWLQLRLDPKR
jgi:hypothetical protein